jgi:hypothetical protein
MMQRRLFLFSALAAGGKAMDFTLDYTFSDGPARVHSAMTIRGDRGTMIRQVASGAEMPIGVWQGAVSAATVEALWTQLPAVAPVGVTLRPGMPNHLIRMKREGMEKTLRLAHQPAVLEKVRSFLDLLRKAEEESSAAPARTLAIRFSGWDERGALVELRAGGEQEVTIPNGAEAIVVQSAPETAKYPLTDEGKGPAGEIRVAAGGTVSVAIPMARKEGQLYQASYRRRGVTKETGGEIFGDAGSGLAPR